MNFNPRSPAWRIKDGWEKMNDYATKKAERLTCKIIRAHGKKITKEVRDKIVELLRQDFVEKFKAMFPHP